ncbi:hypothetical protein [Dactylosporangium sp. NPDC049140]
MATERRGWCCTWRGTRFAAGEESRVVLHRADTAMYEAKRGAAVVLN